MSAGFDPEALRRWAGGEWRQGVPAPLAAVVHDTRHVSPGALFVAIRGARFDGHDFIPRAVQAGAAAAMVSRERAAGLAAAGVPLLVVEDPALALRALATGYRRQSGLTVVGVTGSTGKTTVKEMIASLLEAAMPTARTRGNWNNEIGLPLSILAIPAGTRAGVLELGISHPGEMAPLCAIAQPDWGVITAVGPVHLEFFGSVEAIAREKGELFRRLPPGGVAVLSRDEAHFSLLRSLAPGRVITTSVHAGADADYRLAGHDPRTGHGVVEDRVDGGRHTFRLSLPGLHNRHNALLAMAVARGMGVPWEKITGALDRFSAPSMRWERREIGGITVINDAYNANPLSMSAAVRTFADLEVGGRKWLVLGDMLELGPGAAEEHRAIGRLVAGGTWAGLVTVGPLGGMIGEGACDAGFAPDRVHACPDTGTALARLKENIAKGDAVLVKASRGIHLEDVVAGLAEWRGEG